MRIFTHGLAIDLNRQFGHSMNQVAPFLFWFWWREQGRFQGCSGIKFQLLQRDLFQSAFTADHLALFGHPDCTGKRARWLRDQGLLGWRTTTADWTATTMKQ